MTAPSERLEEAIDLFNRQAFFECHEVLEAVWRPLEPGPEKTFLQGLLQVGVGYHHWQNGNFTGAKNKLTEGLEKLEAVARTDHRTGIELGALIQRVRFSLNCLLELGPERLDQFPPALLPQIDRGPGNR